jgi:hypothetical protein
MENRAKKKQNKAEKETKNRFFLLELTITRKTNLQGKKKEKKNKPLLKF